MESKMANIESQKAQRLPEHPRLARIRFLSSLLDQSILLPGGYRIGLDPLMGLVPWVGDFCASALSFYLIWEAACLGIPKRVLARMVKNVAVDALVGAVPVLGDLFDAVWKANMRNLRLIEGSFHRGLTERPPRRVALGMGIVLALIWSMLVGLILLALYLAVQAVKAIA